MCSVTVTGVDLSTATTSTDDCVIKQSGNTLETIDLTSGSGTSTKYFAAGSYDTEATVTLTGGATYSKTGTAVIAAADATSSLTLQQVGFAF